MSVRYCICFHGIFSGRCSYADHDDSIQNTRLLRTAQIGSALTQELHAAWNDRRFKVSQFSHDPSPNWCNEFYSWWKFTSHTPRMSKCSYALNISDFVCQLHIAKCFSVPSLQHVVMYDTNKWNPCGPLVFKLLESKLTNIIWTKLNNYLNR